MHCFSVQRLMRECVALFAIVAMLLGPLSLAVSRGLSAQERISIAAGLSSLPICAPSDVAGDLATKSSIDCDHCLPSINAPTPSGTCVALPMVFIALLLPANNEASAFLERCSLPPATGPPALI